MIDLPYGRGGSPLQNLIVRGHKETKVSAIRVEAGIDTGAVYMKSPLKLNGSAGEILKRASDLIFDEMIPLIIEQRSVPVEQQGEIFTFKRRKPEDGRLTENMGMETIYDYIRMLDGEGYPRAFIKFNGCRMEFERAGMQNGRVTAQVTIMEE